MQHLNERSLGGRWRFRTDREALGEHYAQQLDIPWQYDARWMNRSHDDGDWGDMAVPACWQVEGHAYEGVAWYRRRFSRPLNAGALTRAWLRFEGVDYYADVWLNERYLGSHEGFFSAFQYEITPYLQDDDNLLCVRVDSPGDIRAKESQVGQFKGLIKGALQRWDANNPEVNPGGIWNDVKLVLTGPASITGLRIHTTVGRVPPPDATNQCVPATVVAAVQLAGFDAVSAAPEGAHDARLRIRVSPVGFEGESAQAVLPIRPLKQPCAWTAPLELQHARLWYTWDTGEPCLYEITVAVELDGHVFDEVRQVFGFRTLEQGPGWAMYLNGIRIFQRGANYLSDQLLSTMTSERYETDIRLLREANLNTVHPFCVVERQEFYDLCDRYGILVYQDFPMWLMMSNGSDLARRAVRQLEDLIEQYGHHPAIVIWNFGSQASVANFEKLCAALAHRARELDSSRLIQQSNALVDLGTSDELPADPLGTFHWTERVVADFKDRFDWRVDTHQYRGWYSKDAAALADVPADHLDLVTEFGAQALPGREMLEQFIPPDALFPPQWSYYTRRCFQPEYQFHYIQQPETLADFIASSQEYQARFLQYHVEHYRRRKFSPCNGAHMFCFNDCWPAITWSVVDYDRRPKAGFYALQRAMAPLQAFLEPAGALRSGERAASRLWVVNDYPLALPDLELTWTVTGEDGGNRLASAALQCDVPANSLSCVGELEWTPVDGGACQVSLRLLRDGDAVAENSYRLLVNTVVE